MKLIKAILFTMRIVRTLMVRSGMFNLAEIAEMDKAMHYTDELAQRMEDANNG